jgi:hypothetical protein
MRHCLPWRARLPPEKEKPFGAAGQELRHVLALIVAKRCSGLCQRDEGLARYSSIALMGSRAR